MISESEMQEYKESLRKLIGSALCDFIAYLNSIKDPVIVGGQYSNEKLLAIFRDWLLIKKFEINGITEGAKGWIRMCQEGVFTGPEGSVTPPKPAPPAAPASPGPPTNNDSSPDDGFYTGGEWTPDDERPKNWTEEGEDWKGGDQKDGDQGKGFDGDDGFQPI